MGFILIAFFAASLSGANTAARPDDWPRWRGPANDGMARSDAPVKWSDTENIAWKIVIPGKGHSSPVVWGDRLFLTTAIPAAGASQAPRPDGDRTEGKGGRKGKRGGPGGGMGDGPQVEHEFAVLAYDRRDGKLLWKQVAAKTTPHEGVHRKYGSFASNTPVTDGKRLYVNFGSRGIYCYDLDGKQIWKRDTLKMRMRNAFGEGSGAVVEGDTLLFNFDQDGGDSFILALDKNTGAERWKMSRDEVSTWSEPYVVEHKGAKQVILTGTKKVRSYDLKSGKLIWECAGLGTNPIPVPLRIDDILLVMSGHREPNLLAIRLGQAGDLTGTAAVLWTNQRGNSYTPSPVLNDGKMYMLTDNGMLSCLDARTGKAHYSQQRLPGSYNFKSSLVGANGKLYMASENEDVLVVKMGEKFEVLATNKMADQMFIATPAIVGGDIYLRSQEFLYCVREKK